MEAHITLNDYLTRKNHARHIHNNADGLDVIYRFMSDAEKEQLKEHYASITYNDNLYDLKQIKNKYCLSYNELKTIIMKYIK